MTTSEFIDAVYQFAVNIGATDAANTQHRARLLHLTKRAVSRFRGAHPWPWTLSESGTFTISALAGSADLMADFGGITPHTKAYISGAKFPLRFVRGERLFRAREMDTGNVERPSHWTIQGMSATTFRERFHVFPINTSSLTISLRNYKTAEPVLVDDVSTPTTDAKLKLAIAEKYHHTILYDYLCARVERDKGGFRYGEIDQEYREELAEAWSNENHVQLEGGAPLGPGFDMDEDEDELFVY